VRRSTQTTQSDKLSIDTTQSELKDDEDKHKESGIEPIAIIGIGCRFPGASGPSAFWELLCNGVDAITEIPPDRFDINTYYDPRPGAPGKIATRWGGFLDQVDLFDAGFFGLAPREASRMDPQQRLLLEVAWEAMENAGQLPSKLNGSRTGVFIGMCYNDYEDLEFQDHRGIDVYVNAGGARSAASGRLSYAFGLEGPSIVIDTACSSSLVAVHLACQSLRSGEISLAIAGAVNLILQPETSIGFSQARMLAPDGRCKVFDARADGFVRSEGIGVVLLKPLAQAQADGNPIYAVIRGSATNNDGRSSGFLMTPGREGQKAVVRMACRNAGILPGQIQYVEAHGTGTSVGDPVETQALGEVLSEGRPADGRCFIGSAKANIGHTEAAAGMAGMIKTALCLKNRTIPPSLHFQEPNPNIFWQELPLMVPVEVTPWPSSSGPALAGVSAFGLSGTNAHVILEESPYSSPSSDQTRSLSNPRLLTLSAHRLESLNKLAESYLPLLRDDERTMPALRDLCYTASVRRDHHNYRLACVGDTAQELAEKLEAYLGGDLSSGVVTNTRIPEARPKLVFVFSGQGPQYLGMGRRLFEQEPVFRAALKRCDEAIGKFAGWSLLKELFAGEESSKLNEIDVTQPALFAIQVALAELWRSWGVEPNAVIGHSLGEVAAAHIAGALVLEDAARVICCRSQLMKKTSGQGTMALVELSHEEALRAIAGYEDRLSVAANNGPTTTVLSGSPEALEEVLRALECRGIFCRPVKVDVASHSPQMEPLCDELEQALKDIQPRPATIPVCSTVTAEFGDGMLFDGGYWRRNLLEPVKFSAAAQCLCESGHQIFIEISPHPVLSNSIQKLLAHLGKEGRAIASLRREVDERASMLQALGEIYTLGYPVDFSHLYTDGGNVVELPRYVWLRERYWFDARRADEGQSRKHIANGLNGDSAWPGYHLRSAAQPGTHLWQMELSLTKFPDLRDHRVKGMAALPAAAYLQITLAAAQEIFGPGAHALGQVAFKEMLIVPDGDTLTAQLVISPDRPGSALFKFYSLDAKGGPATLHASGTIQIGQEEEFCHFATDSLVNRVKARCAEHRRGTEHYEAMRNRGLDYGPAYQGVEELWRRDGAAIARVRQREDSVELGRINAPLLDACFQALEAALPERVDSFGQPSCYLPVGLESLRIYRQPGAELWSQATLRLTSQVSADLIEGDVLALDEDGQQVLEANGLTMRRVEQNAEQGLGEWFYEIQWQAKEVARPGEIESFGEKDEPGAWLIFADAGGLGEGLATCLEEQGATCLVIFPEKACEKVHEKAHEKNRRVASFERGKRTRCWVDPADVTALRSIINEAFAPNNPACKGVIHLWGLDLPAGAEFSLSAWESTQTLGCESVISLIQALAETRVNEAPRLWLISRGAQAVGDEIAMTSPSQSTLWGLGRVIMLEHPELRCVMVDLSATGESSELRQLFREIRANDDEDQIALRGGHRYAARMIPRSVESLETASQERSFKESKVPISAGQQFHLVTSSPGVLDNLTFREDDRRQPARGEVEIEILAAGLNFIDVMKAMGVYPGQANDALSFGIECAGKITAIGEGVTEWQVGDEVMAVVPSLDAFSAYTIVPGSFVVAKPKSMSFEEAATTPIAFLTAYYALHYQGRLAQGERALIHAAAGGVGLAAVQICQKAGAEIYATAGSPEKRDFLRALGVEHVFDSRSLSFAAEVMKRTNGAGVDIVLNSLAGEAIQAGLGLLREGGRFLEIGRQDIHQNAQVGLLPFQRNISFSAIHLDAVLQQRPDLLRELARSFEVGSFAPSPVKVFPISESAAAFRHMAQAKHIGKIALLLRDANIQIAPSEKRRKNARADGAYLITGGLGALGLLAANWLVGRGARRLVLMGRKGASDAAQAAIERMRQAGAEIVIAKADVSQPEQLARVLAEIEQTMAPLKGVIHAAGVLDDSVLRQLNPRRFRSVIEPKVVGAWNLHEQTLSADLDFFVLFSSAAALIGSPGQANYSAGNAFLDGLAHYRRGRGLPALSVNWGPWTEVGMAARPDRGERLALRGVEGIRPEQGIAAMELLLGLGSGQFAVMPFDCAQWERFYPSAATSSLYACLSRQGTSSQQDDVDATEAYAIRNILVAPQNERESLMQAYLSQQIAKVLGIAGGKAAKLNANQPLNQLGMDSLMALEIKNLIEKSLGVTAPISKLLGGSNLAELTRLALDQLSSAQADPMESFEVNEFTDLRPSARASEEKGSDCEFATEFLVCDPTVDGPGWEEVKI
jgi:acyl transferase domain-containing protein/NADPH:quinone reductase-like Zn-dependent oxidoreductase/acyl carrier protein